MTVSLSGTVLVFLHGLLSILALEAYILLTIVVSVLRIQGPMHMRRRLGCRGILVPHICGLSPSKSEKDIRC